MKPTHKSASFVLAFAYIPITLHPHPLPELTDPACAETCLVVVVVVWGVHFVLCVEERARRASSAQAW